SGVDDVEAAIARHAAVARSGLDLAAGPLVRAQLFGLSPCPRLLLTVHHLVVDGVSWRVLLEDLRTAYLQARSGVPVAPGPKTTSLRRW
ncbi:hypothetical protein K7G98_40305, partial [Saccharothrix sp. MB29]|nr:hypothetical protein [Saccharothrix sp. MB29]